MANDESRGEERIDRREALSAIGFWGASLGAAGVLGIPAVRFAVGNSLDTRPGRWVAVGGGVDALPSDTFLRIVYEFQARDAWREVRREGLIYVRRTEDGEVLALSAVCTHLGCNVRWREDESRFACPCHAGFFDMDGNVTSGPPPRPLWRLETRVVDGELEALL